MKTFEEGELSQAQEKLQTTIDGIDTQLDGEAERVGKTLTILRKKASKANDEQRQFGFKTESGITELKNSLTVASKKAKTDAEELQREVGRLWSKMQLKIEAQKSHSAMLKQDVVDNRLGQAMREESKEAGLQLSGSIGEGLNHSNYSDQSSVRIRPKLRRFC